ncbi:MAG: hypothetical protein IE878_00420 [Epsilonproteobacteria bacterium]|nr:hypothetical protein [Campylobacterota bacterium]
MKLVTESRNGAIVDIEKVKKFMRVTDNYQDDIILVLVHSAIKRVEDITNRQLGIANFTLYLPRFPNLIKLPKPPFVELESIKYMSYNGLVELDKNSYELDNKGEVAEIEFKHISPSLCGRNPVQISYKSGYEILPSPIESYIFNYVSTHYEHRESVIVGASVTQLDMGFIESLLDSYRVYL